ncbi:MAG: DMT family transporter [Pseudomonadota bacterium]
MAVAATSVSDQHVRNGKGFLLMLLGMFLFSAVDTQAKFLTDTLHPIQITWTRQIGLLLGAVVLIGLRGAALVKTDKLGLQLIRGCCAGLSAACYITAVVHVPLADAVAVSFVAPFMVTVAGAIFLNEPVGIRRWIAISLGFLGTLIVIRPGSGAMHPAVFLVVLAAALFATRQILSRSLATSDSTETTIVYTALCSSVLLTIPLPFVWEQPQTTQEIALCISIAILAALAEICVIKALELALAVVVAPVMYSLIIWGTVYGFLVFGHLPDGWTWLGVAIIVATGCYSFYREFKTKQRGNAP